MKSFKRIVFVLLIIAFAFNTGLALDYEPASFNEMPHSFKGTEDRIMGETLTSDNVRYAQLDKDLSSTGKEQKAAKKPVEKIPVVLIVDDPPINSAYLMRKQMEDAGMTVETKSFFSQTYLSNWKDMEKSAIIPNAFLKKFIGWAKKEGVKGKCSLIPCPAGFGCLDDEVKGYSKNQLQELINIFKNDFTKNFDITPEMLTHTMAYDIYNNKLLQIPEYQWMAKQGEDTLTAYIVKALQVLKNVGIVAPGITQPNSFKGDFNMYARAILTAEKKVNNITRTFYFNDCDGDNMKVSSKVVLADKANNEYVVSIVSASKADEPFWYTLYGEGDPQKLADYYITEDGKNGRFIDLLSTNSPLVFHVHGQTLYSNGSEIGFQSLQEVVRRMNKHLKNRIEWMKIREFMEWNIRKMEQ